MKKDKKLPTIEQFEATSYLAGGNAGYVEALYEQYLQDSASVPVEWRDYFSGLLPAGQLNEVSHAAIRQGLLNASQHPLRVAVQGENSRQAQVNELIGRYRCEGFMSAHINPLQEVSALDVRLTAADCGLSSADLMQTFATQGVMEQPTATLDAILQAMQTIYCQTVGYEYAYIRNVEERLWLTHQIERVLPRQVFDSEIKKWLLSKLIDAANLEYYLDKKYPGQKRFSNEGLDSMIPLLSYLVEQASDADVKEIKIAMAHRGRINVLINVLGRSSEDLFSEFDGRQDFGLTSGDVKYHRGFSSDVVTQAGSVHLTLGFNPSHLEFINPVMMGSVRARQDRYADELKDKRDYAFPVMIHGDAAFCGQGIVMESLQMSQTVANTVGGTIHIIANNQVGFTTSDPQEARSSLYSSDVARMIDAPILHVNADDPEMVLKVVTLAFQYRMKFHKDVVIDLVGFRRHGHQEVDEPRATQPLMYQKIDHHPGIATLYAQQLQAQAVVSQADVVELKSSLREQLDAGAALVETTETGLAQRHALVWQPYLEQDWGSEIDTSVPTNTLHLLLAKLAEVPEGFVLQRNVAKVIQQRQKMAAGEIPFDWGCAELLAYASLLLADHPVRLCGEDACRGTFFHRHALLHESNTGETYQALDHLSEKQASASIYNSFLSETGAMGFEYGYSLADPKTLVIWEAQFGDFANVAQVIIDQFISSGWQKWRRLSGLVLLLPHGYEGMGPEHSSCRLERYMQLCAQDNMQVFVPTTPAQIFHLLRRQVLRPYRKPLVVLTPKSFLRHPEAVSHFDEFTSGGLQLVIDDVDVKAPESIKRIVLCSGKIYYELLKKRRELSLNDVVLVRVEQLYPFPYQDFSAILARYPNATHLIWCQEEPKNQGAWFISRRRFEKCMPDRMALYYACRPASAAPAAGYSALFKKLQAEVIDRAFSLNEVSPFHCEE